MRILAALTACIFSIALAYAGDAAEKAKKKVLDSLQGEWSAEKAILGGKDIAENLTKQSFHFKDKTITVRENDQDTDNKSKFEVDAGSKPPTIDVETKEGNKLEGIFEVKGDRLKICISLQQGIRPTEFNSPADSMILLAEFKRIKK